MPGWADTQAVLEAVSIDPELSDDHSVLLLVADEPGTLRKAKGALTAR
jgi:hypothetical protein